MDTFEAAKVVHERTLKIETEQIAKKVVGYVYFQDYPDQVMIRLVLGPDNFIQYLMLKAKVALQLSSAHVGSLPSSPSVNPISIPDPLLQYARFPSLSCHRVLPHRLTGACHWEHRQIEKQVVHNLNYEALSCSSSFFDNYRLQNQSISSDTYCDSSLNDVLRIKYGRDI